MSVSEAKLVEPQGYASRMKTLSCELFNLVTGGGPVRPAAEEILFPANRQAVSEEVRAGAIVFSTLEVIGNSVYLMEVHRNDAHLLPYDTIRENWTRLTSVIRIAISQELDRRGKLAGKKKALEDVRATRLKHGYGPESGLEVALQADCQVLEEPLLPANATDSGPSYLVSISMRRYLKEMPHQESERWLKLESLAPKLYGEPGDIYIRALNSVSGL